MHTVPNDTSKDKLNGAKAEMNRSIAQPGSAPGLGPGGRRFESYCSDHLLKDGRDKRYRVKRFFYA